MAAATTGGALIRGGAWQSAANLMPQLYTLAISVAGQFLSVVYVATSPLRRIRTTADLPSPDLPAAAAP